MFDIVSPVRPALDVVRDAIRHRWSIAFLYPKAGKTPGRRVGEPYVLFVASSGEVQCLVYQTEGVTDSREALPGWRQFEVRYFQEVAALAERAPFAVRTDFRGDDLRYEHALASVAIDASARSS